MWAVEGQVIELERGIKAMRAELVHDRDRIQRLYTMLQAPSSTGAGSLAGSGAGAGPAYCGSTLHVFIHFGNDPITYSVSISGALSASYGPLSSSDDILIDPAPIGDYTVIGTATGFAPVVQSFNVICGEHASIGLEF